MFGIWFIVGLLVLRPHSPLNTNTQPVELET